MIEAGAAAISVSSGGLNTGAVPCVPLYQIPYAETIRTMTTLPVVGGCRLYYQESEISQILQEAAVIMCFSSAEITCRDRFLLKWQDELGLLREERNRSVSVSWNPYDNVETVGYPNF